MSVRGRRGGGFTLIELLVVIALLGVLLGLLGPHLAPATRVARDTVCDGYLVQLHASTFAWWATTGELPLGDEAKAEFERMGLPPCCPRDRDRTPYVYQGDDLGSGLDVAGREPGDDAPIWLCPYHGRYVTWGRDLIDD